MEEKQVKLTPMYRQYSEIKHSFPDSLLFFRMGDFYELFFKDAEIVSRELQLTLTSRNKDADGIPMCGVPWHASETYIAQLVEKGYKIAVCDQMEDPKLAKGLVKRAVTRVITGGTVLEDANLEAKSHNYLGSLYWNQQNDKGAFAWLDVSTGEWSGLQSNKSEELSQWILKFAPRELLYPNSINLSDLMTIPNTIQTVPLPYKSHFEPNNAFRRITENLHIQELGAVGLEKKPELLQACGALLTYLEQIQRQTPVQLKNFVPFDKGRFLILDDITERNLELFRKLDGKKGVGTLWNVMDFTRTPMGGRLLEERMHCPWRQLSRINATQDIVEYFLNNAELRKNLRQLLDVIYDIERVSTRISLNRCSPRDFASLKNSLSTLPDIKSLFYKKPEENNPDNALINDLPEGLRIFLSHWDNLSDVYDLLQSSLLDTLPLQITDGNIFKRGYNEELDELLDLCANGENCLQDLLKKEQQTNGLPKLKLGFNHVFGYYFELTKSQLQNPLPDYFQRRQSLANSDRFTTAELKKWEEKILSADDKRKSLEYRLYQELREKIALQRSRLLFISHILSHLDFWQSLAEAASVHSWNRPVLEDSSRLNIKQGRHPVVEAVIGKAAFIPNDLTMDENKRLILITGPNMGGKSTILRQTALIVLMAQMGSFVPADSAVIGIADRIFSRVGASDNLSQGQSTFMVEMVETARILRMSGKRSFVILDEIGRGTSTFDGLSIAWAVVEDLVKRSEGTVRTLFATHYHELTALEQTIPGIFNMNVTIREWNGDIIFLRKLIPGSADKSYGIEVAKLAGVPLSTVNRAKEILNNLQQNRSRSAEQKKYILPSLLPQKKSESPDIAPQSSIHDYILAELNTIDSDNLTSDKALKYIRLWKDLLQEKNREK